MTVMYSQIQSYIHTSWLQVTAFHRGYHEFKIAPHHNMQVEVTTDELNQHVLHSPGGSSHHTAVGVGFNNYTLELPAGLTCDQCVLQWRYRAGQLSQPLEH